VTPESSPCKYESTISCRVDDMLVLWRTWWHAVWCSRCLSIKLYRHISFSIKGMAVPKHGKKKIASTVSTFTLFCLPSLRQICFNKLSSYMWLAPSFQTVETNSGCNRSFSALLLDFFIIPTFCSVSKVYLVNKFFAA
jgi:hypothetical protein